MWTEPDPLVLPLPNKFFFKVERMLNLQYQFIIHNSRLGGEMPVTSEPIFGLLYAEVFQADSVLKNPPTLIKSQLNMGILDAMKWF